MQAKADRIWSRGSVVLAIVWLFPNVSVLRGVSATSLCLLVSELFLFESRFGSTQGTWGLWSKPFRI